MIKKIISILIIFCLAFPANLVAQVLPDGSTATFVDYSLHNNTPVVNIAAPSGKGVSHNKFSDYNVDNRHLILNNTKQDGLESKLGGYIVGNPNLIKAGKEAGIILNEVTSNKKTMISGYTEILGNQAELIIANPSGITISGGGFINTSKLSFVTGSANMYEGGIANFSISQRGKINILGRNTQDKVNLGIDGSSLTSLYLVGRGVNLTGDIYAPEINILTGNHLFNYDEKTVNSVDMNTPPGEFAIDASAVGSMYGGRINIIGTEKGFGVRSQGELVASLDDIFISNTGDIEYKRATANKDVKVNSTGKLKTVESFAKGDINFVIKEADYETLRASGDINITADKINHQHNAESGGDINIEAKELNVLQDLYPSSQNNVMLAYGNINLNIDTLNNSGEIAAFRDINITSKLLNNHSLILANENLNISQGNIFNNKNAVLFANNNISIKTDGSLYNTEGDVLGTQGILFSGLNNDRMSLLENKGGTIESSAGSITIASQDVNNISIDNCDPSANNGRDCLLAGNLELTGLHTSYRGDRVVYRKEAPTVTLEALSRGYILAANDITFDAGDVLNQSSVISAGEDIMGCVDNSFVNTATTFDVLLDIQYQERYKKHHKLHKGCGDRERYFGGTVWENFASLTPAIVSAQNIDLTVTDLKNGRQESGYNAPWANTPINQKLEEAASTGVIDPIKLTDFGQGGMFKEADPNSRYLYVNNNRFVNIYDFVGSNYFNEKMGFMSDFHGTKWLGDPVYEQRLLEKAILEVTGNHYLYEGIASMNDQMIRLYDNAFEAYNSGLGLEFGKALTQAQIAQLSDNIVWYVEQEINGQIVMVPTLYVAASNADKFLIDSKSAIQGGNINIDAVDIHNSGNITGANVELRASNNISNISGIIAGNENVVLDAGNDILIETKLNTLTERNGVTTYGEAAAIDYSGKGYTSSWLGETAGVYSGGKISMNAGNDINIKAAEVISGGEADLSAGGNINIGAQQLNNSYWNTLSQNALSENSFITNIGSYIESGGNFNVTAGKNAAIQASDIVSYGDVNLTGENVTILSALDSSHQYSRVYDGGAFSTKLEEHLKDTQTHIGSNITALGDVNINAKNDATILASSLGGFDSFYNDGSYAGVDGGSINIGAGNNINILAGQNYEATMDNVEKSSWFGFTGSKDKVYDEVKTLEASTVFAGKDLNLTSGKDTTILAGDVGAQGNGNIDTGGSFNLLAGVESAYHYEEHSKTSFDLESIASGFISVGLDFAKGSIAGGALGIMGGGEALIAKNMLSGSFKDNIGNYFGTEQKTINESYQETLRAATLSFGGGASINAKEDITIKGSDIYGIEDINITGGNINILSQELSSYTNNSETDRSGKASNYTKDDGTKNLVNAGSNIMGAGGSINIKSSNDITVIGGNIGHENMFYYGQESAPTGSINLEAANNVSILAATDIYGTYEKESDKKYFGLSKTKDLIETQDTLLTSSSVLSAADINIKSGADTTISASNLGAQGDGNIETGGNLNILSGLETSYRHEEHYERGFDGIALSLDSGRVSAGVTYSVDTATTDSYQETARAANLNFGGDFNADANGNVTIKGSNVGAGGDINIAAEEIHILAQELISKYKQENEHQSVTASVGIGNAYVDAGYAVDALIKAVEAADDAKNRLSNIEKLYKEGKASKGAVDDAKAGLALATASLAQATLAVAQAAAGAAAAATSGLGTGLYANAQVSAEVSKDTLTNANITNQGSTISGVQNVNLTSRGNTIQTGSDVISDSGDITYNVGGDLLLTASADSGNSRFSSESYTASVSVGTNGGSLNAGYNESDSVTNSTTYTNSTTQAQQGAINYNVGGDMHGAGYNANAKDIDVNVEGALSLESLQDSFYSRGNSMGVSGGIGFGNKDGGNMLAGAGANVLSSVSGGFNTGNNYTDMAWVNNQTGLIASNSITVDADSIDLKGGTIANITESGTDGGNLNINSNSLTYSDIKDINVSENSGFGLNITLSDSRTKEGNQYIGGTTTLTLQNEGDEKEQLTRATIGQGNINIGGAPASDDQLLGLNRDISNTQEITKDMITGALDASLTVDNRMLNIGFGAGYESIGEDLGGFVDNVVTAGAGVVDGTMNLGKAAYVVGDTILDGGGLGMASDKVGVMQTVREFELNINSLRDKLEKEGKTDAEIKVALDSYRKDLAVKYGVADEDVSNMLYAKDNEFYAHNNTDKEGNVTSTDIAYRQGGYYDGDLKGDDGNYITDADGNRIAVKVAGTNLIDSQGNLIDDKTYTKVSTHEDFHGLGKTEEYAQAMGDFAEGVSGGSLTIMKTGSFMGDTAGTSGSLWLASGAANGAGDYVSNAGVVAEGNQFFTNHSPEDTENVAPVIVAGVVAAAIYVGTAAYVGKGNAADGDKIIKEKAVQKVKEVDELLSKHKFYTDGKGTLIMVVGKVAYRLNQVDDYAAEKLPGYTEGKGAVKYVGDMYDEKVPQEVKDALRVLGTAAEVGVTVAGVGALAKVGKTGKTLSALDKIDDVADAAKAAEAAASTAQAAKAAEVAKVVKVAEKAEDIVEDTAKAAKAAQAAEAASSTAQATKATAEATKIVGATVKAADGSTITINSVDDFLNAVGKFTSKKSGKIGSLGGNVDDVFKVLVKDSVGRTPNGGYIMKNGDILFNHSSTTTKLPTIDVNRKGKIYKVRIEGE